MFGNNEIVGKKFFNQNEEAKAGKLFVVSRFYTLQGEGPFRGQPAYFLRLAKCNLACSFCDTFFDDGRWMTIDEIKDDVEVVLDEYYASKNIDRPDWTRHSVENEVLKEVVFVLTGGEPLLQDNATKLLEEMNSIFGTTQVESNGTMETEVPYWTTLVVSPKCAEKNGVATKYLQPRQSVLDRADCLKFVMSAETDSPYNTVPDWALDWKNDDAHREIFVSPMNIYNDVPQKAKDLRARTNQTTVEQRSTSDEVISFWEPGLLNMEENRKNHEYTAQYCMAHGLVFNMQLHLFASLA